MTRLSSVIPARSHELCSHLTKDSQNLSFERCGGGASSPVALLRFSHACSGDDISAVLSENEVLVGVTSGVLDR